MVASPAVPCQLAISRVRSGSTGALPAAAPGGCFPSVYLSALRCGIKPGVFQSAGCSAFTEVYLPYHVTQ